MERKKRRGDRKDGWRVRDTDTMHIFTPYILINRADCEAFMTETIDLTAINDFLEKKNADQPEFKYTIFHVITAAVAKVFVLRPHMNRFYAGRRFYDRKDITFSFVVKKKFDDNGEESLAILKVDRDNTDSPLEQIHTKIRDIVYSVRKHDQMDGTTDKMGDLLKLPRFVLRFVMSVLRWLDYHGWYPDVLMNDDPYFSSVFISNLGSIKMHANYHHLTNWGTNSVFLIIGEKKPTAFFHADGTFDVREAVELSLTVDERIADGLYFANSMKLLRTLLENPELLEQPMQAAVESGDLSSREAIHM
jgi:hypothetical protein